jgi:uncharacterized membrane protein HdeD (DUF308 family)
MADSTANPPAFGAGDAGAFPWWVMLIEGIAALLLGIMFFTNPAATTGVVIWFLALYWVLTGVIAVVSLFWDRTQWGWKLFWGIVSIMAGWYVLTNLLAGALLILWVSLLILGIQGLVIGIVEIVQAFQGAGWGRGVLGAINLLFGVLLTYWAFNKPAVISVFPYVFGAFAIVGGIAAIVFSFQLRKMNAASASKTPMTPSAA